MLPGVVRLSSGPPTRDDYREAALVYAGPGAVLTGLDALDLHGLRRMPHPSGAVHVLIPPDRRRVGAGRVLTERTDRLPEVVAGRWPLAPVARAALDFCRRSRDRDQVRSIIAEVVQTRRCRQADLVAELAAGSQRGSALPRQVLAEISDGVRSVAEADARRVALRSGLPAPRWNVRLVDLDGRFVAVPDAWFDDVGLAWEIDSREFHILPADYDRTIDRRSAMTAHGIVVLHTQPRRLRGDKPGVLDELRRSHAQAALLPPPSVRALPGQ